MSSRPLELVHPNGVRCRPTDEDGGVPARRSRATTCAYPLGGRRPGRCSDPRARPRQHPPDVRPACRACKGQCEHAVCVHIHARSEHQIEYGKVPLMTSVFER